MIDQNPSDKYSKSASCLHASGSRNDDQGYLVAFRSIFFWSKREACIVQVRIQDPLRPHSICNQP